MNIFSLQHVEGISWCKRLHPKNVCEKVFRQPPLRKTKLKKQDLTLTKPKIALLLAADRIGKTIQYHCTGFLPNRRQHRMAGLAAIEIAQKVSKIWRSLQSEWRFSTKNTSKSGRRARRKERIIIPSPNKNGARTKTELVVVLVVTQKDQLQVHWKRSHQDSLFSHGFIFIQWPSNGERFPNPVTLLFGSKD
ncbi:hypothetical protein HanRHA438_Chr10g0436991 [Helianthus annuus]|nr:putative tetratricopeptide repeat protein SRFR1 [Helianthus annuus]KAJ0878201.1 hypothetical protein HanRHA438_Chr10g0436991 [Helianthus annuus]KAJ0882471.1 hypothetical protein HanPSC8_Chr10g0410021 [Helianthus annuus]